MRFFNRSCTSAAVVILAFGFGFLSLTANAQTKRKRSVVKVAPIVSPTPPIGDAQIISQASDQPVETKTFAVPGEPIATQNTGDEQPDPTVQKIKDLSSRIKKLEAKPVDAYDEKQKRMLLNLDILTRAEQRSESLRKQLFEMLEKENTVKTRIDQIDFDLRPETISRSANYSGSLKPEEIREFRKKSLDAEKRNLQTLLEGILATKDNLTANVLRSDQLVEKLRTKLEKDIDDNLKSDEPPN